MVTQTCGCAEADAPAAKRPAKAKIMQTKCLVMSEGQTYCAGNSAGESPLANIAWSAAEWRPQIAAWASGSKPAAAESLQSGSAPVGARIVGAFEGAVGMQQHRAGMAHGV